MKRIKSRILPHWHAIELTVPVHFNEVDSMKLVWHGHYLRYCEDAREQYCGEHGLSYKTMEDEGCVAPVVRLQVEYYAPARMGWHLQVRCARLPGSEPMLNLFYEIRGPVRAEGSGRLAGGAGAAAAAGISEPKLLCVVETVQVFIDNAGVPYLSAPPAVEAFFDTITARERALAPG